ncbi:hypothetical protein [Streptomyces sp. NPDC053542]|uniref:hypothetical protein n=1 Tax=Streptomyces sp. NPDC053542 TaxID=3365710 RepID=UPI0037D197DA
MTVLSTAARPSTASDQDPLDLPWSAIVMPCISRTACGSLDSGFPGSGVPDSGLPGSGFSGSGFSDFGLPGFGLPGFGFRGSLIDRRPRLALP